MGKKIMLFSVEQAFVGRDKILAPLKTPAWEAKQSLNSQKLTSILLPYHPTYKQELWLKGLHHTICYLFEKLIFLHQNSKNIGPAFLCKTIKYFGIETVSDMG